MTQNNRPLGLQDLGAFLLMVAAILFVIAVQSPASTPPREGVVPGSAPEGKKAKRKHNLPPGSISSQEITSILVGGGLSVDRPGPPVRFTIGYGVSVTIPKDVRLECRLVGLSQTNVEVRAASGAPYILLPIVGKLWPIGIVAARLEGDLLTIELDGWADYQVKIH